MVKGDEVPSEGKQPPRQGNNESKFRKLAHNNRTATPMNLSNHRHVYERNPRKDEFQRTEDACPNIQMKNEKTTQYLPRRENIRTVNVTSSRIKNVPHGGIHMR